jgi:phosphoribosylaminoimidazolecarboxamide formyltransferase/IMP cyclohydrolase
VELRYGMNPQQPAQAVPVTGDARPVRVLNGSPSYINLLDALNGWQLVHEAGRALGRPTAASFKHVSPAGAAVSGPLDEVTAELFGARDHDVRPLTGAYLRARDADPKSSYGDLVAVSQPVDQELAEVLTTLVSDGIVAPGYDPGVVGILSRKKKGSFLVMEADEHFIPPLRASREVFGLRMTQERDPVELTGALLDGAGNGEPHTEARDDLLLGLIVLRYTQSNSVCYVKGGRTLGIGAGQQSRVDCTRLAGAKTDIWWARRHPAVRALAFQPDVRLQDRINWQIRFAEGDLTEDEQRRLVDSVVTTPASFTDQDRASWRRQLSGVAFASDGALPFRDNVDHAARYGVRYIAEPGGSIRSDEVAQACLEHRIRLFRTGLRLFHH